MVQRKERGSAGLKFWRRWEKGSSARVEGVARGGSR